MSDKPLRLVGKLNVYTMHTGDGREIELSVVDGYISWRRLGDANWIPLVSVEELQSPDREVLVEMQRSLSTKVELASTIQPGNLVVANEEGNIECAGVSCESLISTLEKKTELVGDAPENILLVSDGKGNIVRSDIYPSDLVKVSDLVTGSITRSKEIEATGYSVIHIPEDVLPYPNISVYHNGMILVEGIHYVVEGEDIRLLKDTSYKGDIFTFTGYGSAEVVAVQEIEAISVDGVKVPVIDRVAQIVLEEDYLKKDALLDEDGLIKSDLILATNIKDLSEWISDQSGTIRGLSDNNFSDDLVVKLESIESGAQVNIINDVSEEFQISDDDKILSILQISQDKIIGLQKSLDLKVSAVEGMGLSHNDLTDELVEKILSSESNYIKSVSEEFNVSEDGELSLNTKNINVDVSSLTQKDGDWLVLHSGGSSSL